MNPIQVVPPIAPLPPFCPTMLNGTIITGGAVRYVYAGCYCYLPPRPDVASDTRPHIVPQVCPCTDPIITTTSAYAVKLAKAAGATALPQILFYRKGVPNPGNGGAPDELLPPLNNLVNEYQATIGAMEFRLFLVVEIPSLKIGTLAVKIDPASGPATQSLPDMSPFATYGSPPHRPDFVRLTQGATYQDFFIL